MFSTQGALNDELLFLSKVSVVLPSVHNKHLPVLVAPELVEVGQDGDHRVALAAVHQVCQGYLEGIRWGHHVKNLVFDIKERNGVLSVSPHLLLDRPEEEVESKDRKESFMPNIQDSEEILQRLGLLLVLHGKDKIKICLVVHLSLVCQALLEDPLHSDLGEGARPVSGQLRLTQHPVVIEVQVEVLTIDSKSRRSREPVCFLQVFGELVVSQLEQVVKEGAGEDVLDFDLPCSHWIEKEEKLSDSSADVETVEGLLKVVQLRQRLNQLKNVVFEVGLSEETLPGHVVEAETDPGLMQPDLPHHIVEEGHDGDPAQPVPLLQLGKHSSLEVALALLPHQPANSLELLEVHHLLLSDRWPGGVGVQHHPQLLQLCIVKKQFGTALEELSSGLLPQLLLESILLLWEWTVEHWDGWRCRRLSFECKVSLGELTFLLLRINC